MHSFEQPAPLAKLVPENWDAARAAYPWLSHPAFQDSVTAITWALWNPDQRAAYIIENLAEGQTGNLKETSSAVLTQLLSGSIHERHRRWEESNAKSLEAALAVWPDLRRALQEKGRRLGLNGFAEPKMPGWSDQPVVPVEGWNGRKPRTRAKAMDIALSLGDGSWATIGELWLWVGGGGPIVTRTLQKFNLLEGSPSPGYRDPQCSP